MRVAVTGSSGLIGTAVVAALTAGGHTVVRLVRRPPTGSGEVQWDPEGSGIDTSALGTVDAGVHLAGEGIGARRWSDRQKQRILDSRVKGTGALVGALGQVEPRPAVLVSGSAVGYYGLRGDEILTEESAPGSGFLADLVGQWEAAAVEAEAAGIRTVRVRTGIVLARGGALGRMLPLFRLGLGGRLGRGDQWWSWISLRDEVGIILHALTNDTVTGPINATAPAPVTNAVLTRTLGEVLRRPTMLPVPKPALQLVMGKEMTDEVILAGQRVLPAVAESTGYRFQDPELEGALRRAVAPA